MTVTRDKLKARIAALLAKTVGNGCTEAEALAAASKVADLLDRHAMRLDDVAIRASPCERATFATRRNKRMPLEVCVGAIAAFCDCRAWREKGAEGEAAFVFFGLPEDAAAARDLAALVEGAIRAELGRYKTSRAYRAFDHKERHLVNASFAFGIANAIADKLDAMKDAREARHRSGGRDLVAVKSSVVDEAYAALGLAVTTDQAPRRMVAPSAFEAGEAAGAAVPLQRDA